MFKLSPKYSCKKYSFQIKSDIFLHFPGNTGRFSTGTYKLIQKWFGGYVDRVWLNTPIKKSSKYLELELELELEWFIFHRK